MLARVDKALEAARVAIQGRKVLVLGSSPNLVLPVDYNKDWCLIAVNASGRIAKECRLGRPDITVMAASVLLKSKPEFDEVRENISGLESDVTIVRFLSGGTLKRAIRIYRAKRILDESGYKANQVIGFPSEIWKELGRQVLGNDDHRLTRNMSTGVFCVILAISMRATRVVTAGIDPMSRGHAYSMTGFAREHQASDLRLLDILQLRFGVEVSI